MPAVSAWQESDSGLSQIGKSGSRCVQCGMGPPSPPECHRAVTDCLRSSLRVPCKRAVKLCGNTWLTSMERFFHLLVLVETGAHCYTEISLLLWHVEYLYNAVP